MALTERLRYIREELAALRKERGRINARILELKQEGTKLSSLYQPGDIVTTTLGVEWKAAKGGARTQYIVDSLLVSSMFSDRPSIVGRKLLKDGGYGKPVTVHYFDICAGEAK